MRTLGYLFLLTHFPFLSLSYALSFSLPSLFLVTVYPVEGSGNTNRLSLPCGFSSSSSSYPFCLLLFLYSSVPYFPSSICAPLLNGCSSIRLVDLPAFCTAPKHFCITAIFILPTCFCSRGVVTHIPFPPSPSQASGAWSKSLKYHH